MAKAAKTYGLNIAFYLKSFNLLLKFSKIKRIDFFSGESWDSVIFKAKRAND
jgi:hypothetical protein